jgi:hypothetical protein
MPCYHASSWVTSVTSRVPRTFVVHPDRYRGLSLRMRFMLWRSTHVRVVLDDTCDIDKYYMLYDAGVTEVELQNASS